MDSVPLRDYVDMRFSDMDDRTELAREAMEKRLDGMNEFRDTLRDQASKFIPRTEYDILCDDVQKLKESRAEMRGKASQNSVIVAYIFAVIGIGIGIVGLLVH